jgi:hypothetical protein
MSIASNTTQVNLNEARLSSRKLVIGHLWLNNVGCMLFPRRVVS